MKVLFFAQCREAAGCEQGLVPADSALEQGEFWARLIAAYPALEPHRKTARLARREVYLQGDELLQPGDEIAVIPPVSGG